MMLFRILTRHNSTDKFVVEMEAIKSPSTARSLHRTLNFSIGNTEKSFNFLFNE